MENDYKYFKNEKCKYFPCHNTDGEIFNCMFCFCPLYPLGDKCGGNFYYKEGVKICTDCLIPHGKDSHDYICDRFKQIHALAISNHEQGYREIDKK